MRAFKFSVLLSVLLVSSTIGLASNFEPANTVFTNGKIYTMDRASPWVEAVAVKDGRYVALGSSQEVKQWVGSETKVIDLGGKMAMPGINDAHSHMYGGLKTLYSCNFNPASSLSEIKAKLQQCAADSPEQKFIMGGYWSSSFFDDNAIESPRKWLDEAVGPDVAVVLSDDSGHNVWVNTAALSQRGYTADTVDPDGGTILREANGEPNGLVYEVAAQSLEAFFNNQWPDSVRTLGMQYALNTINSYGVTGLKDAWTSHKDLQVLHDMDQGDGISAHIGTAISTPYGPRKKPLDYDLYSDLADKNKSTNIHTGFIKFFLDGVPTSSRTAAMLEPYLNDDADTEPDYGMLHLEGDFLAQDMIELDKRGFTIKLHAAGDRSVREVLNAIEKMRLINGNKDSMHEIAHAGFISDDDISRFKELNVAADISPYLWYPSPIIDNIVSVVGDLGKTYFPNRKLTDSGATIIGGSDWPSVSLTPNPWPGIEATVTRKDPFGVSPGTHWVEQKLSLEETLRVFTVNGAKALKLSTDTGSIELGKYADIIVLRDNLFDIPQDQIGETVIEQTWFKGKLVFSKPN